MAITDRISAEFRPIRMSCGVSAVGGTRTYFTSAALQKYRSVFRAGVKLQTSNETRKAPKATAETGNG